MARKGIGRHIKGSIVWKVCSNTGDMVSAREENKVEVCYLDTMVLDVVDVVSIGTSKSLPKAINTEEMSDNLEEPMREIAEVTIPDDKQALSKDVMGNESTVSGLTVAINGKSNIKPQPTRNDGNIANDKPSQNGEIGAFEIKNSDTKMGNEMNMCSASQAAMESNITPKVSLNGSTRIVDEFLNEPQTKDTRTASVCESKKTRQRYDRHEQGNVKASYGAEQSKRRVTFAPYVNRRRRNSCRRYRQHDPMSKIPRIFTYDKYRNKVEWVPVPPEGIPYEAKILRINGIKFYPRYSRPPRMPKKFTYDCYGNKLEWVPVPPEGLPYKPMNVKLSGIPFYPRYTCPPRIPKGIPYDCYSSYPSGVPHMNIANTLIPEETITCHSSEMMYNGPLAMHSNTNICRKRAYFPLAEEQNQYDSQSNRKGGSPSFGNGKSESLPKGFSQSITRTNSPSVANGNSQSHRNGKLGALANGNSQSYRNGKSGALENGNSQSYRNAKSQALANGNSQSHRNGKSEALANGNSQSYRNGKSGALANGNSQSHRNGKSEALANGNSQSYRNGKSGALANGNSQSYRNGAYHSLANGNSQSYRNGKSGALEIGDF